jgi:hypothetical protein
MISTGAAIIQNSLVKTAHFFICRREKPQHDDHLAVPYLLFHSATKYTCLFPNTAAMLIYVKDNNGKFIEYKLPDGSTVDSTALATALVAAAATTSTADSTTATPPSDGANKENNQSNNNSDNNTVTENNTSPNPSTCTGDDSSMGKISNHRNGQRDKKRKPEYQQAGVGSNARNRIFRQTNMFGKRAFEQNRDCVRCRHNYIFGNTKNAPHRGHHPKCPEKPPEKTEAQKKEKKRQEMAERPLEPHEKMQDIRKIPNHKEFVTQWITQPHAAAASRCLATQTPSPPPESINNTSNDRSDTLCQEVNSSGGNRPSEAVNDTASSALEMQSKKPAAKKEYPKVDWHGSIVAAMANEELVETLKKKSNAPLPMSIVAHIVQEDLFPSKALARDGSLTDAAKRKLDRAKDYFSHEDLSLVLPKKERDGTPIDPWYHMIEGQRLFVVCWYMYFPFVKMTCREAGCNGKLKRDRTNFSKNKKLLPVFNLSGAPDWAMIMKYKCTTCGADLDATDPRCLMNLPHWMRQCYPVDPKYIPVGQPNKQVKYHLRKTVTDMWPAIMPTYANGQLISHLLYGAVNMSYEDKVAEYTSYHKDVRMASLNEEHENVFVCPEYPENPTHFLPRR